MNATTCLSLIAGASVAFTAAAETQQSSGLSADETRALVADMLAEAEQNASFSSQRGWNQSSAIEITGGTQFRYIASFSDNDGAAGDDFDPGFQFGTTRLAAKGTLGDDQRFGYYLQGNFAFNGGNFGLEDMYVTYDFGNNWGLKFGQMKVPFLREELIDDFYVLTVDRSVLNETFTPNRTQGIALAYADEQFRANFVFSDGANAANTSFNNNKVAGFAGGEADYGLTARVEFKGAGVWDQFDDFTSTSSSEFAWLLGGAVHYEGGEAGGTGDDYEGLGWTLDVQVEGAGWNAYGAYVGIYTDTDAPGGEDFMDHGFLVQGGWLIPDSNWELFGRYDLTIADGDRANDDAFNTITVGANNYIHGHAARFTVDVLWALDNAADSDLIPVGGYNNIGFVADDDEDALSVRAQFQLMF